MSQIHKREITQELEESYLDYAMSVIVSRALPDVRDGLKPVHRRILWDMWDTGLVHQAKFRKSANVVGSTLGRYHPHGDMAVYDALVRMAQDFSLRYPLIQGQGNFGSVDSDPPAAQRYTEVRLSRIAEELLFDIEKETVEWAPNYDATRKEPMVLPAKLPNLLLNGSLGIAVGMATSIPPHNLREVGGAILHLASNPDATVDDLLKFVQGPDFPTGGIIFDQKAIREAYRSGRGPILARAKAEIEERKNRQFAIVVTEIPYQVNKAELVRRIAELVQEKKIEGIRDLRDESDREGMRIVIELKSDVPPQKVLNQLYLRTDLQKDFHLNMIALVRGIEPQLLSLRDILAAYLEYRKVVVRRRSEFDLKKAEERAHILAGLTKALSAIDRVIATIKKSRDRDEAHRALVRNFSLSDLQATAILEMRLQTLAALERKKIDDELKEKLALAKELQLILKSPAKILKIITDEVEELMAKYGDNRRTQVVPRGVTAFSEEDLTPDEEAVITLSASGYIKRLPPGAFQSQRRGGKGLIGSEVAEEDFLTHFAGVSTHDNILFFTDRGRVFQTKAYEIPPGSRTAKGKAIHNFLEFPPEERVNAVVSYPEKKTSGEGFLVMVTAGGIMKKTLLDDFRNIRRSGIIAISLKKGDALRWAGLSSGKDELMLVTSGGQAIRFRESQVRPMGRTASGIRAIRLKKNDSVAGFAIIRASPESRANVLESPSNTRDAAGVPRNLSRKLLVVMANGFGKQSLLKEFKVQNRGGSGIRAVKITPKTGPVVASRILVGETEILALSAKGQVIRTQLESVRTTGRASQGVRIMNLKSGDRLAGVVVM